MIPFQGLGPSTCGKNINQRECGKGFWFGTFVCQPKSIRSAKRTIIGGEARSFSRKGFTRLHTTLTPVPLSLERKLHDYFDRYRIQCPGEKQKGQRKNLSGELFRLPVVEVEAFKTTVANIEKWVLLAEEALLELQIMRMEAHGRASEQ